VTRHECPGETCARCTARIDAAEDEWQVPDPDDADAAADRYFG
jgi:hypothetical protein